jgi:hypothetical protein
MEPDITLATIRRKGTWRNNYDVSLQEERRRLRSRRCLLVIGAGALSLGLGTARNARA